MINLLRRKKMFIADDCFSKTIIMLNKKKDQLLVNAKSNVFL